MIAVLEIGMVIFAIVTLVRGKMTVSRRRVVVGTPARLIALIGFLPLPVAFGAGFCLGMYQAISHSLSRSTMLLISVGLEVAIALGCFIAILVLGYALGKPPEETDDFRVRRFGADRIDLDREAADRFRRAAAGADPRESEETDAYTDRPEDPPPPAGLPGS